MAKSQEDQPVRVPFFGYTRWRASVRADVGEPARLDRAHVDRPRTGGKGGRTPTFTTLGCLASPQLMRRLVNPVTGKTINWRAGCGKTASPVRREGGPNSFGPPYPYQSHSHVRRCRRVTLICLSYHRSRPPWIARKWMDVFFCVLGIDAFGSRFVVLAVGAPTGRVEPEHIVGADLNQRTIQFAAGLDQVADPLRAPLAESSPTRPISN